MEAVERRVVEPGLRLVNDCAGANLVVAHVLHFESEICQTKLRTHRLRDGFHLLGDVGDICFRDGETIKDERGLDARMSLIVVFSNASLAGSDRQPRFNAALSDAKSFSFSKFWRQSASADPFKFRGSCSS